MKNIRRSASSSVEDMAKEMIEVSESKPRSLSINHKSGNYAQETAEEKRKAFDSLMDHTLNSVLNSNNQSVDRIKLRDTEAVKIRASAYMEACRRAGAFPTLMGFSASLGLARKNVWEFCSKHPEHETAQLIQRLQSAWADLMTQMAMRRQCAEVMSIFLLKNSGQGLTDRQSVEITPSVNDEKCLFNEQEIRERYILADESEEMK